MKSKSNDGTSSDRSATNHEHRKHCHLNNIYRATIAYAIACCIALWLHCLKRISLLNLREITEVRVIEQGFPYAPTTAEPHIFRARVCTFFTTIRYAYTCQHTTVHHGAFACLRGQSKWNVCAYALFVVSCTTLANCEITSRAYYCYGEIISNAMHCVNMPQTLLNATKHCHAHWPPPQVGR